MADAVCEFHCESRCVGELRCEGVAECRSYSVGELLKASFCFRRLASVAET